MKEAEIAPAQGLFLAPKSPFRQLEKRKNGSLSGWVQPCIRVTW